MKQQRHNPTVYLTRSCLHPALAVFLATTLLIAPRARATVDDALSFAYEAATPYVSEGFLVREEAWAGDLGVGERKGVAQQLFKGNEYWFWAATDAEGGAVSVHVYDSDGNLAEVENWQRGKFAAARIIPKSTGTYYILLVMEKAKHGEGHWAMVYGYR